MSESDPIIEFRPSGPPVRVASAHQNGASHETAPPVTAFSRQELSLILRLYGRMVAAGEWRDYAIDFGRETASFAIFRRASECPVYRIVKTPKLARKQGAYAVVAAGGQILKRGADLARVLNALDKPRLVQG